jgi:hypothetical protein
VFWGTGKETGASISGSSWGELTFFGGSDVRGVLILKDGGRLYGVLGRERDREIKIYPWCG